MSAVFARAPTMLAMRPDERIIVLQCSATKLAQKGWTDMDLVLDEYDFPTVDPRDYREAYRYALDRLKSGPDAALAEIDRYLNGSLAGDLDSEPVGESTWAPGSFRLFISHTSTHKSALSASEAFSAASA
jgi:hypothetical protein